PFLCRVVPVIITIRPGEGPIFARYHLAECRVGETTATYDPARGQFEAEVERSGTIECTGILRPYSRDVSTSGAAPELRIAVPVRVALRREPRPDRLGLLVLAG